MTGQGLSALGRLAAGGVVQYRTLDADLPSAAIAHALGFQRFARTLAVRLIGWNAPPSLGGGGRFGSG